VGGHTGGLCDTVTDTRATTPDRQLEARCNAIAAAILMPRDAVLGNPEVVARKDTPQAWNYPAAYEQEEAQAGSGGN
jgi:Zn-dependent peptidase ImmA (M78 family)